jgi:hypothetical protein
MHNRQKGDFQAGDILFYKNGKTYMVRYDVAVINREKEKCQSTAKQDFKNGLIDYVYPIESRIKLNTVKKYEKAKNLDELTDQVLELDDLGKSVEEMASILNEPRYMIEVILVEQRKYMFR